MRKQLAIGVSVLALTALGGVSENNVSTNLQGASPQYTHFVRTSLNQTFEPLSRAGFDLSLPNRPTFQTAGVHFIVGDQGADFGNDDAKNNDFSDPTGETCKNLGYTVTSCASGMFNKACPYNDKIYDKCCDATYKYTSSTCASPKKLSSDSCGGKYRCYCDTTTYPYATCNSPQIKGNSCTDDSGTHYATCTCPSGVATPYGCETYYASPCNNVCQKAYADNCRNRTSVQTPYGCETYFSDCSSKCQKAYADNCRNRTAVSTPYGCKQYYGDCQSKCEIAYSDNCHNRTAVISSCPSNATCSYFSDCSSKISSWSCNSGYKMSGNSCIAAYDCASKYAFYKGINDKMKKAINKSTCRAYISWNEIGFIMMNETCTTYSRRIKAEITEHNSKCSKPYVISSINSIQCSTCCEGGRNGMGYLEFCSEDSLH